MTKPRILITTAGGKTGMPTALQLLEKGYRVRAFMRAEDGRSAVLREAGAEIFIGDLYDMADMRRAMKDCQRAYYCAAPSANAVYGGAVFAVAAQEARLEHVVALSQWLADPLHPSFATRQVWLTDAFLKWMPDVSLTINNVGWFADNYMYMMEPAAQLGLLPMPLGDGLNAPPSNEDIAAVTVGALSDPARHAGKVYRPTGPKLLTPQEIAGTFGKVLGRKVRYRNIPDKMFHKALRARGFPAFLRTQLVYYVEEYRRGTFAAGAPSDAVQEVGGREPEDFETIVRRYAAHQPDAVRSIGNKVRAALGFGKILITPAPDNAAEEREADHVLISKSHFAPESAEWLASHASAKPKLVAAE